MPFDLIVATSLAIVYVPGLSHYECTQALHREREIAQELVEAGVEFNFWFATCEPTRKHPVQNGAL